ncbi:MAG TPA: putative Fe-S cluster assembly protein SufT [Chthoniobacteraceae bacterium]
MNDEQTVRTNREVQVLRIPSGEQIQLPADTPVVITQALGGSFTLLVPTQAGLFRLSAEDADAIGHEASAASAASPSAAHTTEEAVWSALRTCYDPEIPVNIVDLGLIYHCEVTPAEGGSQVSVKMTLTAPGCGMGPVLAQEAESKILTLPGVAKTSVELVWDPPWSPDRISAEGRQKLGME